MGIRPCGVATVGTAKVSILDCARTLRILTASAAVDRRVTGREDSKKEGVRLEEETKCGIQSEAKVREDCESVKRAYASN